MATLDWTTEANSPAQVKKELLHEDILSAGERVRYQIGPVESYDEFYVAVPAGKQWTVVSSIRIIETDV